MGKHLAKEKSLNSSALAKRIVDCISDGYDDEEYREETETELYSELSQLESSNIVKIALLWLCGRIEELEMQTTK